MNIKYRHELVYLAKENGIGIELGVARGELAEKILKIDRFNRFYGVDKYDDHHDEKEFQRTLKKLSVYPKYRLHRMTFEKALKIFSNNFFDFIYIDGYAHTGQDNGKTLYDWYEKLKPGGLFCGDDYTKEYPLTISNVNRFVEDNNLSLNILDCHENTTYSKNPSWYLYKPLQTGSLDVISD